MSLVLRMLLSIMDCPAIIRWSAIGMGMAPSRSASIAMAYSIYATKTQMALPKRSSPLVSLGINRSPEIGMEMGKIRSGCIGMGHSICATAMMLARRRSVLGWGIRAMWALPGIGMGMGSTRRACSARAMG